jgi:hypothetical protein
MSAKIYTDAFGNPINPGDSICYPVRRGARMWLSSITVTQVTDEGITGYNPTGRRIHVEKFDRCAVVHIPKVKLGVVPKAA